MDILLTGASGFIGSHLQKELIPQHRVFAVSRQDISANEEVLTWVKADLSQPDFEAALPDKVDAVVHLAQSKHYRQFPAEAKDIYQVNIGSTMTLLEYSRKIGVSLFIFASSANVYKSDHERLTEDSMIEIESFYACSKRIAEMLIESYARFFKCIVFRLFTVYGPGQVGMLLPSLIKRVQQNQPIQVQGTHGLKLSPIYVSDVCTTLKAALESGDVSPGFDVFNVGGEETVGVYELGLAIGQALNVSPRFEFVPGEEPAGWLANNSKLRERFNLEPFISVESGVRRLIYG